ncbi:MAG: DUF969 family protein [Merdibacter sp.]
MIGIYGVFRLFFAAFNISFGGAAGFIRPIVMPMASAAVERDGKPIDPDHLEQLKGMSAGMDNVAWFFGQVLFVGTSGMLLVQSTLADLGYEVELMDLMMVQIPVALCAVGCRDRLLLSERSSADETSVRQEVRHDARSDRIFHERGDHAFGQAAGGPVSRDRPDVHLYGHRQSEGQKE